MLRQYLDDLCGLAFPVENKSATSEYVFDYSVSISSAATGYQIGNNQEHHLLQQVRSPDLMLF